MEEKTKLVRDLMSVGVPTCPPDALAVDIARLLLEKSLEAVVVLDGSEGHALGIVSQAELVKALGRDDFETLTAAEVMREGVPEAPPDIPVTAAAQLMLDQGVRVLFMMHHSAGIVYPAAYLSFRHILRLLSAREGEDLRDLGIAAERKSPLETFLERREEARQRNLSSSKKRQE